MSRRYVFDAEPLIAYLFDEPGASSVEQMLTAVYDDTATAAISEVTATEVSYKTAWLLADDRPKDDDLFVGRKQVRNFLDQGLELLPSTDSWTTAARVKADGGISLGDAFAVALAAQEEATLVVGADGDFEELPIEVDLERVRDEPATDR